MSNSISTKASETDFKWLRNATDEDIDLSDDPEVPSEIIKTGVLRRGGKIIERSNKVRVNMYLDADLVTYFKEKAQGRGYQTLINEALRESVRSDELEDMLRRVIREEVGVG